MQIIIEIILSILFVLAMFYIGYVAYSYKFNDQYYLANSAFTIAIVYFIYLVPRFLKLISSSSEIIKTLAGYTFLFKEIFITVFLLYLFRILCIRYSLRRKTLNYTIISLAIIRIILLLLPYNNWASTRNYTLIVLSMIPFLFIGILLTLLYKQKSLLTNDKTFSFFWIIIALYVFSAILEMFFYATPYIVYPNLITVLAIYWSLFKDISLASCKIHN